MTRDEKIEAFRNEIVTQANSAGDEGWMSIPVPTTVTPTGSLKVPRGAFELWAVADSGGGHLAAPWKTISPVGIKQGADDPNHTDWMLGAGLHPLAMKSNGGNPNWEALSDAVYKARAAVERRLLNYNCSVLLQGPSVTGRVHIPSTDSDLPPDDMGVPPITVIRSALPKWFEVALATFKAGGAVIVENGGEMAHLVTEFRPNAYGPMIRVENARKLYPAGSLLEIQPKVGEVRLVEDSDLVAERVNAAMNAPAIEDDIVDMPRPEPQKPGFGIAEHKGSLKTHPSYHTDYLEPAYKFEGQDWEIYASWHYSKTGFRDLQYGYEMYLHFMANEIRRDDGGNRIQGGERRLFISDRRIWKDGETRQACQEVLYFVDPEERYAYKRAEKLRADQKARDKAKLASLDDERLIRQMAMHGQDENGLDDELDGGDITSSERFYMLRDYARLFDVFEELAEERGLQVDMDTIRPYPARKRAEYGASEEERQRQQAEFEKFMADTKPRLNLGGR